MPPILDATLETGTGYVIAPCETEQAAFMKKIWDRTGVRVCVNTDVEAIARGKTEDRHSQRRTARLKAALDAVQKMPQTMGGSTLREPSAEYFPPIVWGIFCTASSAAFYCASVAANDDLPFCRGRSPRRRCSHTPARRSDPKSFS